MEALEGIRQGFEVALSLENLLYVTSGVVIGTFIGVLPGLGATAAIAVLLPFTYGLSPTGAIIMLAGIYYGSMFGSRVPAILLNLPGDSTSVITTFDGYPLRQQGLAGPALGITAIGSFVGGTAAIIGLTFFAPTLAQWALRMGPPELFLLALIGVMMIVLLASESLIAGLVTAGAGMLIASIGRDPVSADWRLTGGVQELSTGIHIVPLAVGLFGLAEIIALGRHRFKYAENSTRLSRIFPGREHFQQVWRAIVRSSFIGFFLGIVPGGGGTVSSIVAYGAEKKFSKHPEKFGKGAIDGLAATETADNASSNSSFIPLLTLGLPPNAVLALIFGALLMHNVTPGPSLIRDEPEIFWGVIASMYIGSIILLVVNLPLIRVFTSILSIPGPFLLPGIVVIAMFGVYSVNNSYFDMVLAALFGVLGFLLKVNGVNAGPLILGYVLSPIMEAQWRRTMLISDGSMDIFVDRPISLALSLAISAVLIAAIIKALRRRRVRTVSGRD